MKNLKLLLALVVMMGAGPMMSMAQHSMNTIGGNVSNTTGSVSYSIGQIVYCHYSNHDCHVSEGVQQPYEIYVITSIHMPDDDDLSISVFPNPAGDHLILSVSGKDDHNLTDYQYVLMDMYGRTLKSGIVIKENTLIDMSDKKPGVYFLQLRTSKQAIGLLKVIKR